MQQTGTVLLVEDDENDALFFQRAISKSGLHLNVCRVGDGKQAIDYLSRCTRPGTGSPVPKMIVTDSSLPMVPGGDFLQWLSEHSEFRSVPTIVLSGTESREVVSRAYSKGVHSYFLKPGSQEELVRLVKKIYDYWSSCLLPGNVGR